MKHSDKTAKVTLAGVVEKVSESVAVIKIFPEFVNSKGMEEDSH